MAAVPAVLAIASAGATIYGGISAYSAGQQQSKLLKQQGDLAAQNAAENAQIEADNVRKTAARQKMQFLANGLDFSGSAILTSQDTLTQGQKYVNSIAARGTAERNLDYANASVEEQKGRASLIGSIGGATAGTYSAYKNGAFASSGQLTQGDSYVPGGVTWSDL